MSTYEGGFCPYDEYLAGEAGRVMEAALSVDALYMLMLRLKSPKLLAAKYPTRMNEVTPREPGLHRVRFTILTVDLIPDCQVKATMHDGYWQRASSDHISAGNLPVLSGYFQEYGMGIDTDDQLRALLEDSLEQSPEENLIAAGNS